MRDISNKIDLIFNNENSLISTCIDEILINKNENNDVQIFLKFSNFSKNSSFSSIKLFFKDIIEYSFYHNDNYNFYNIESYKLLKIDNYIYLSLDPDNSIDGKSDDDLDYIFAKKLILMDDFK